MPAEARRDDILDRTAALIVARGLDAITMDAAAAASGVSKALLYRHFADRDALVVAVLAREIERLRQASELATRDAHEFRDEIAAALPAYFDVATRGSGLLGTLVHTTHLGAALRRLRVEFVNASEIHWASQAARAFGLDARSARIASAIFLGGLGGLDDFMRRTGTPRAEVEAVFVRLVLGALPHLTGRRRPSRT